MEKRQEGMPAYEPGRTLTDEQYEKKLDWMYKSPHQMVNREEYLLGKPIDKSFEELAQAEKTIAQNHVEHECVPPSLRFFSGNEQVDLIRKMQEDPLYAIKKKELETRCQLLKNPVKLKQLKQLVEQQTKQAKRGQGQKEKKHKGSANSRNESEIDILIISKIQQLRERVHEKYIIECIAKVKRKSKRKQKQYNVSPTYDLEDGNTEVKRKRSGSKSHKNKTSIRDTRNPKERDVNVRSDYRRKEKIHKSGKGYTYSYNSSRYKENTVVNNRQGDVQASSGNDSRRSQSTHKYSIRDNSQSTVKDSNEGRRRMQLSEEEKERRRREMMANAVWRDQEREKNTKQYTEEERRELNSSKSYDNDFIRKQLAATAETGTVASRIKSNINNIQRSDRLMDTNFARR